MKTRFAPPAVRAFTLVELLVVVVIISLLAGLIVPALGKAKATAQGLGCLSNLKQWGVATLLYAIDNEDLLPPDGAPNGASKRQGWYVDLPRILEIPPYHSLEWRTNSAVDPDKGLWICPSNRRRSNGNNLFHYCLNQHVNRSGAGNQIRLSSIGRPSTAVWLFDNGKLAAVAQQNNVHTNLHRQGANFVFLDGHAARFPAVEYWDFENNKGRTNHPELVWFP